MANAVERCEPTLDRAEQRGLSRRQLVKAGVWATPVVVLAAAAPASASSIGLITVVSVTPTAQGNDYRIIVSFASTYPVAKVLTFASETLPANSSWGNGANARVDTIPVPAGSPGTTPASIGRLTGAASGSSGVVRYSVPTGTTPATELVEVHFTIP